MDIEYLLLLQNFRNAINDALTPFMEMISLYAITTLCIVPAFVYWCVSKRMGLFTFTAWSLTTAFNATLKLTVCAYRPWIRDARILPAGDAIATAGGYSFPSGHTTTATPIYGSFAANLWKRMRFAAFICIAGILLTGFSRNYLGVHTPQDVLVGLAESCLFIFATFKIFKYLDANPEKEKWFLLAGFIIGWIFLAYVTFKPYHVDYVNGKILVDPQRMMIDAYGDVGQLIFFCVARFIDKTWIKFKAEFNKVNIAYGIIGAVLLFFIISLASGHGSSTASVQAQQWAKFASRGVLIFYVMVLWPLVMKLLQKKNK